MLILNLMLLMAFLIMVAISVVEVLGFHHENRGQTPISPRQVSGSAEKRGLTLI